MTISSCPCQLIKKLFIMPIAALAIFAASLVSLIAASVLQTVFDIQPCILCIYQRGPYLAAFLLSVIVLAFRKKPIIVKTLMTLIGLAFLANVGIAAYHSGIERGLWKETESCAVTPLPGAAPAKLTTAELLATAVGSCEEINFSILGLTLANLNVFLSLGLAAMAFCAGFGLLAQGSSSAPCTVCRCAGGKNGPGGKKSGLS